ncbi:prephenate dehydrogenase [Hypnocyclicus thermotrophus]|uniref:Prephenate dehydrogenase n=1 Tax=Hypnocyclicus thermotrophus TaxID=1627895 RepID=A0AA46DZJ2_9FUSO|nr:prephenate dehydrogenase [Hypnocyclicus thermotrophus]TDT71765.1 prephenate dehydrogenase [Hypnocyclicus thermotrophus]
MIENGFNITIVGFGLMGASYAMALKKFHKGKIYAVDIDKESLLKAKDRGLIDEGFVEPKEPLEDSKLVIICLYPKLLVKFIEENKENFQNNAIITDISGVKCDYIEKIDNILQKKADFVSTHPMAGREKQGMDYADANIFQNANFIIIKKENNKKENVKLIENLAKNMGFLRVTKVTAKEHDNIIAFTSQLTHAIAVSLVNSDDEKFNTKLFIGDSYRDLTRIAKINSELWSELFLENKENLIYRIDNFIDKLETIKNALLNEDKDRLIKEFKESSDRRDRF